MEFYLGRIWFNDGREFTDYYVNEEDARSYYERSPDYVGCIRAELFRMAPDEDNFKFEEECIFEYDVNGDYYYIV